MALFLFLLAPFCGELLSGSSPPAKYFQPLSLLLNHLLYGGGAILIREATIRWRLGWSQLLLAAAYGILEEGLCCKSFFDPDWPDLRGLSNYAAFYGVQWSWTLMLITFHMTMSTLIPIRIVQMLFPALADEPLLGRRCIFLFALGVIAVVVFGYTCFPTPVKAFHLSLTMTAACLAVIALLTGLAFRLRSVGNPAFKLSTSKVLNRAPLWAVSGFILMTVNLFTPYLMASFKFVPPPLTIATQLVIMLTSSIFCLATICQKQYSPKRDRAFITGCLFFWICVSCLQANWMPAVGAIALLLLWPWYRLSGKSSESPIDSLSQPGVKA